MQDKEPAEGHETEADRYIIWEGPNAESLQWWEDQYHDHHDRMSVTHATCPDCGSDIHKGTDWAHPVHRKT